MPAKKYHVTRGGNRMLISDMTDDHLKNTIFLLQRHGHNVKPYVNELKKRTIVILDVLSIKVL